jgi:hypothetical protein
MRVVWLNGFLLDRALLDRDFSQHFLWGAAVHDGKEPVRGIA